MGLWEEGGGESEEVCNMFSTSLQVHLRVTHTG